jgi:hypothetical protein
MPPQNYVLTDDAGRQHAVRVVWRKIGYESGRRYGVDRTVWYPGAVSLADGGEELIEVRAGRWQTVFSNEYFNGNIPTALEG